MVVGASPKLIVTSRGGADDSAAFSAFEEL
jgi:hypothetical protein